MIYLLGSIAFMTALAIAYGAAVKAGANPLGHNIVFRLTGGLLALAAFAATGGRLVHEPAVWQAAAGRGVAAGVLFWLAGLAAIKAVTLGRLGITWTVTRCAVALPTLASILYWREVPLWPVTPLLAMRLLGVSLTVMTFVLINAERHAQQSRDPQPARPGWAVWLVLAFLAQGGWEIMLRSSRDLPDEAARGLFILTVFVSAMIFSLVALVVVRPSVGRVELGYGLLAGVCGFAGSGLRPWAVRDLPGIVVFPATAIGVLVLVLAADALFWKQRIGRWGFAGLAAACAAILCLTV